ncbi:MAG: serine O-acetyltransferase [Rhodospirillaceae bacterium]|nr:serine O-acetyltransferase [Rhodospirillaceae bacterium]MBT6136126.1 serine O-acetyltransferase [Rhodospirillaceae bacterium]
MAELTSRSDTVLDPVWVDTRRDAIATAETEPALASMLHAHVLSHDVFEDALSYQISQKLGSDEISALSLHQVIDQAIEREPSIAVAARADLSATFERDPACHSYLEPFLFFKGFHALQCQRVAHHLWANEHRFLAKYIQSRASEVFGVDMHPAAKIGRGIMIDHATGVVVGETAVIEDGVSMLHGVTLGGTGKEGGDRHPKIRGGTMIGANATILGNIEIGKCSRIGAGSVVLENVPPYTTVAGVPAKVIGGTGYEQPAMAMDQQFLDCTGSERSQ